jgi:transcriptional regulator with XRE-family HTH domain
MPREKLTDEQVAAIRAAVAEGDSSLQEIAEQFGTSKQHVSRLARGEQRTDFPRVDLYGTGSVTLSVQAMLEEIELSPADDVVAATAIALAEKLDSVRASTTAQSGMAAPGLARALSEQLSELIGVAFEDGPRLGGLRGDEAVRVARELGIPDYENVDIECFDELEVIRLHYARRRAAEWNRDSSEQSARGVA